MDSDSGNFSGGNLTVAIVSGSTSDDRVQILDQFGSALTVNGSNVLFQGDVIGTWSGGTNGSTPLIIAFTSAFATPAAVQALAQSIGYSNVSSNPGTGNRQIQFAVSDGDSGNSLPVQKTVTVTPYNSPPVVTLSTGSMTYSAGSPPMTIDADVVVSDLDSADFNSGDLIVSFLDGGTSSDRLVIRDQGNGPGLISLNGTNVLFSGNVIGTWTGGTNGSLPLSIHFTSTAATPGAVQALARNILYSNTDGTLAWEDRTVEFELSDGDGASQSAWKYVYIVPNVYPILTTSSGSTTYLENAPPAIVDSGIVITDPDSTIFTGGYLTIGWTAITDGSEQLTIHNEGAGAGKISLDGSSVQFSGVVIGTWDGGSSYYSPLVIQFTSPSATTAAVQALARQIAFSSSHDNPETVARDIEFTLTDGDGNASNPSRRSVIITPLNDPPVITTSSEVASYSVALSWLVVDDQLLVSDIDSPDFNTGILTVRFQSGHTSADRLGIRNEGTGAGQISVNGTSIYYGSILIGTYTGGFTDNTSLVITLNANATPQIVQSLARNITFQIDSPTSTLTNRVIRFQLTDGDNGTSGVATRTININIPSSNHSPVLALPGPTVTYSKLAAPVVIDGQAVVTDPDEEYGKLGGGTLLISINVVKTGRTQRDQFDISSLNAIGLLQSKQVINGRQVAIFQLNESATALDVQSALRGLKFSTSKAGLKFATRTVTVSLEDSGHATSGSVTKSINVSRRRVKSRG